MYDIDTLLMRYLNTFYKLRIDVGYKYIKRPFSINIMGDTSNGKTYTNVAELWQEEIEDGNTDKWYDKARDYWSKKPASIDGMLDGQSAVSFADLTASRQFLTKVNKIKPKFLKHRVVDCGAGIGRVSKGLLIDFFDQVDILEPEEKFISHAKEYVQSHKVGELYHMPLQNFEPAEGIYDCFWMQWSLLYLTDAHLIALLKRCKSALRPNGLIFVKENVSSNGRFYVDKDDHSVMRSRQQYVSIFRQAGFDVVTDMKQPNFPDALMPVWMYCLEPSLNG